MPTHEQQITPPPVEAPRTASRARTRIVRALLLGLFLLVVLRLAQIQILEYPHYRALARKQYEAKLPLPAVRGSVYDRTGAVLASNSMFVSFAADPQIAAEDARVIAAKFSRTFNKARSLYMGKLRTDSRFVWLERQVHTDVLKKLNLADCSGIVTRNEPKRLYHHSSLAGQLIGSTDIDNKGIAGIELEYDGVLRGADGYVVLQRDGLGHARAVVDYPRVEPVNGHSIVLSIDVGIQSIVEDELRKGVERNKAEGGIAIVIEPSTGYVLAVAQVPPVNPARFGAVSTANQRLRAVTDMFEPGSVFKIVTASAAFEDHLIRPEQEFFAENGAYTVALPRGRERIIRDTHPYGTITFRDAMAFSSNIVMAKASDLIGAERLYRMARDFGFGTPTLIELPGEVPGRLKKPSEWSRTTLNTMAFGYEVAATPMQIAAAYAAVANDGILMKPTLLVKELDAEGAVVQESRPQAIRRVVTSATARELRRMLTGVVDYGTGAPAQIQGVAVAGKTGTSRKVSEGKYESGNYTASFAGFLPADDARLVCLVMLDNPRAGTYYGGTVSAPVFREIARKIMTTSEMFASAPQQGSPSGGASAALASPAAPEPSGAQVPDVRGCSVRKAVAILSSASMRAAVKGTGIVVEQNPAPGAPAARGMKVGLTCRQKQAGLQGPLSASAQRGSGALPR